MPLQPAVVGLVIVAEDQLDQRCVVIRAVPDLPEIADTEVAEALHQLGNEPLVSACSLVDDLRVTGPDAICGCHGSSAYGTFSMIETVPSSAATYAACVIGSTASPLGSFPMVTVAMTTRVEPSITATALLS